MIKTDAVHLSLWNVCVSFVAACTQDWCYNSDLFGAENTDKLEEVTCPSCLDFYKEFIDAEEDSEPLHHHEGRPTSETSGEAPSE
jgi:hypothetical protein